MLISHEFMHAFGNVNHVWLDAQDESTFTARTQRLVQEANAYTITTSDDDVQHLDGKRTLEENLADLGGIRVAYDAFAHAMSTENGAGRAMPSQVVSSQTMSPPATPSSKPTPVQRFFLAFANLMREKPVKTPSFPNDFHSPEKFRVNGPLSNMPEFAHAFGCKDGDPMVRPASQRVELW
jgi:putative endopeptidase